MQHDSRAATPSRRTLLSAKIIFNNKSSIFDCQVRALSAEGAELRMKSTLGVPDAFQLVIKPHDEEFDCEITKRTETDIGVTFWRKPDQPPSPLLKGLRLVK